MLVKPDFELRLWFRQVKEKLSAVDPYFTKLADAMVTWIDAWTEISNGESKVNPTVNGTAKTVKK